jgi:hypothetical protein
MNRNHAMALPSPFLRVAAAWFGLAVLTAFLLVSPATVTRLCPHRYLASYLEIIFVGLIPVLLTIHARENWSRYGLTRMGLAKSLFWSLVYVAVARGFSRLTSGHWMTAGSLTSDLSFPGKAYYALLGAFAYGPLEMFFFVWLVSNTEHILQGRRGSFFFGLTLTTVLYALLHVIFQGLGAATVAVPFFVLTLIFRWTNNSIGPMIAWTLLNQQVWSLASLLWS